MAFDEVGQADTKERKVEICERAYKLARRRGLPARGHHLRSQHLRHRHRDRGASPLRARLHRRLPRDQGALPARPHLRRPLQPQLLVPRQRAGAPGHALDLPLPRHPRRARHGDRQCRPARRLRHDRPGASRGLRGRHHGPPRRRDRAAGDPGREVPRLRSGAREGRGRMARLGRRQEARARPRQGHRRLCRRRHRGSAPDRPSGRSTSSRAR